MERRLTTLDKKLLTLISFSIFIALSYTLLSVPSVNAAQTGCCEKTKDIPSSYCVSDTTQDKYDGTFHSFKSCSEVESCKLGVMVCRSGCTANKTQAETLGNKRNNCTWSPEKNVEDVEECKVGCCSIPEGLVCNVKQNIVCTKEAGTTKYTFEEGIIKDSLCSNYCGQQEWGTCVLESGCEYSVKKDCIDSLISEDKTLQENVNFFRNTPVCDVIQCGAICEEEQHCGKPSYGNNEKICWYDNQGNIGKCAEDYSRDDCGGGIYTCTECESEECNDSKRGISVKKNEPYCKYTSCDITLKYGGQEWSDAIRGIKNLPNNRQEEILNSRSICYNFYTKFVGATLNDDGTGYIDNDVLVSTGLQNSKIVCQDGVATQQTFGPDRGQLCEQLGANEGLLCKCDVEQINNAANCRSCGTGGGSIFGDIFQTSTIGALGDVLGADKCDAGICEGLGDCVYHVDWSGGSWGSSASVGSCDPKFPLGDSGSCSGCGKGGDALYNMPTKQECYSLGNCDYGERNPHLLKDILPVFTVALYGERLSWTPIEGAVGAGIAASCLIPFVGHGVATIACGGCVKCLVYGPTQFVLYGIQYPLKIMTNFIVTPLQNIGQIIRAAVGSIWKG